MSWQVVPTRARLGRGSWLAALAATAFLCLAAAPSPSAGRATLKPDLKTREFREIKLCQEAPGVVHSADVCKGAGRVVLRFTNQIANKGAGPLVFAANEGAEPNDCHGNGNPGGHDDDVLVNQRLYVDKNGDGRFERSKDTRFRKHRAGCRYYHPAHDHYHLSGYATYSLRKESTGNKVGASKKASFCISDTGPFNLSLPGAPNHAYYGIGSCEQRDSVTGTSVGWFDEYRWNLYGQSINVTNLHKGKYCLISEADPPGKLREEKSRNNTQKTRIRINPGNAPAQQSRNISPLKGHCRLGH